MKNPVLNPINQSGGEILPGFFKKYGVFHEIFMQVVFFRIYIVCFEILQTRGAL